MTVEIKFPRNRTFYIGTWTGITASYGVVCPSSICGGYIYSISGFLIVGTRPRQLWMITKSRMILIVRPLFISLWGKIFSCTIYRGVTLRGGGRPSSTVDRVYFWGILWGLCCLSICTFHSNTPFSQLGVTMKVQILKQHKPHKIPQK